MIMRTAITVATVVCFVASSYLVAATADSELKDKQHHLLQQSADEEETNLQQQSVDIDNEGIKIKLTDMAARFIQDYVTPTVCSYLPGFCSKNQIQSRGLQSYLATAGTLFAGVLGVILTKIKILVVLSLVTTVIGKLLLLIAYTHIPPYHYHHGHHHHSHKPHGHHAPFVKYTKDKYYIKNTPSVHSHDVIVDSPPSHHTPYHSHPPSGGVSYYKR